MNTQPGSKKNPIASSSAAAQALAQCAIARRDTPSAEARYNLLQAEKDALAAENVFLKKIAEIKDQELKEEGYDELKTAYDKAWEQNKGLEESAVETREALLAEFASRLDEKKLERSAAEEELRAYKQELRAVTETLTILNASVAPAPSVGITPQAETAQQELPTSTPPALPVPVEVPATESSGRAPQSSKAPATSTIRAARSHPYASVKSESRATPSRTSRRVSDPPRDFKGVPYVYGPSCL
ncbi:hypothetical protein C8R43DRAFT_1230375 [Mycena crocata]|nr:hypothetical protein C8R43DRAFT_1230375 [Mycena crocata]